MHQIEMISLNDLVPSNHSYRQFSCLWNFSTVSKQLKKMEKDNPYKGYGLLRLFKCLLLQFMEDLSDRELERYLQENNAAKWFCKFNLSEKTPEYSVFSKCRKRFGTHFLSKVFSNLRDQLKQQGVINEVFSFIDASHLITKANLWKERDAAIKKKYEQLNNEVLPKVAADKQARIGCKGKEKYGYGYKKHTSVDMQSGLINKVAVTPANVTDAQGMQHVCPDSGAIYDCTEPAKKASTKKGCHLRAIKKHTMRGKNKDQDRWFSGLRSPYERVFAHQNKRVCFNLKRLIVLDLPNLTLN